MSNVWLHVFPCSRSPKFPLFSFIKRRNYSIVNCRVFIFSDHGLSFHEHLLRDLCRLCGGKSTTSIRRGQPNSKELYKGDILKLFDIDIRNDDKSIHPPFICDGCRVKISRIKKKIRQRKQIDKTSIFTYEKHTDQCRICSGSDNSDIDRRHFGSKLKDYAEGHGFSYDENDQEICIFKLSQ